MVFGRKESFELGQKKLGAMKSRSHRLPMSDPHDDWVDGSWTVDCVCGVNFDDGEEMVNCDECGVWVHTRCSRYVKSEKSFACDKCKSKNSRNDSEETEVAQLLVELPNKTLRLDNPYPSSCPPRGPFRLWTDRPIEERVHFQGIPGGDPDLLGGLSSVFSRELWKCSGYVPKKFSFQYREFTCWDEKQHTDRKTNEEYENPVNKGADVLFSLSKNNLLPAHMGTSVDMHKQIDNSACHRLSHSKETMKFSSEDLDARRSHNGVKKDRSLLQPIVIHSSKCEEEYCTSKDRNRKKKARLVDKDGDFRRVAHGSKTGSTLASDTKNLEFCEDKGPKILGRDSEICKKLKSRCLLSADPLSVDSYVADNGISDPKSNLTSGEQHLNALYSGVASSNSLIEAKSKEDEAGCKISPRIESSHKIEGSVASVLINNGSESLSVKKEVTPADFDHSNDNGGVTAKNAGTGLPSLVPLDYYLGTDVPEVQKIQDSTGHMMMPRVKVKAEVDINNYGGLSDLQLSPHPNLLLDDKKALVKHAGQSVDHSNDVAISSSQSKSIEVRDVDSSCGVVFADTLRSPDGLASCSSAPLVQCKVVISGGKSLPTSSSNVISKPFDTDPNYNSNVNQRGKKDDASARVFRDKDEQQKTKNSAKELSKSLCSVPKTSHPCKSLHASVSKRSMSDSKDLLLPSSRTTSTHSIVCTPSSGESATGSLQTESATFAQNKSTASEVSQKGEKTNQSNCRPSSKLSHAAPMHSLASSNAPATLSDEELALLLHQELNSSPRVPRVPRMRNSGSLPQLSSPSAALMKRTSSSGGKDNSSVSRKKSKDLRRDASRSSFEADDTKNGDSACLSSDQRTHDSACVTDSASKREADTGPTKIVYVKRSVSSASNRTASGGPSSLAESNEQKFSSKHNSPRITSDDDVGMNGHPTYCTLPGLIAEIMSKGKRMTYDELCNAVLPHWPNLRKHNGERYAYSSHSQAVLDCLRNRNEWARLVDRGPKTNARRKRRKLDTDPTCFESEDNESSKDRVLNNVDSKCLDSHHPEEFPKGKRKARKRRRLALQGRDVKDVRKRRIPDVSGDDVDSFSNSSEDSIFSEDDMQGGETCPVASEASASTEENGASQ